MKKKIIQYALCVILGTSLLRCNTAQSGFNAPDGSTVEYSTQAIDLKFAGSGEILQLATVKVSVAVGSEGSSAANQIQGSISCVYCNLYVFKDDVPTYLPIASLLNPVAAKSFVFKTNTQGLFVFVIGVVSPLDLGFVDSSGTILSYSDNVIANIGTTETALAVTAGPTS